MSPTENLREPNFSFRVRGHPGVWEVVGKAGGDYVKWFLDMVSGGSAP